MDNTISLCEPEIEYTRNYLKGDFKENSILESHLKTYSSMPSLNQSIEERIDMF